MTERTSAAPPEQSAIEAALYKIRRVIAGQDRMLERVLVCLLARPLDLR